MNRPSYSSSSGDPFKCASWYCESGQHVRRHSMRHIQTRYRWKLLVQIWTAISFYKTVQSCSCCSLITFGQSTSNITQTIFGDHNIKDLVLSNGQAGKNNCGPSQSATADLNVILYWPDIQSFRWWIRCCDRSQNWMSNLFRVEIKLNSYSVWGQASPNITCQSHHQ